MLSKSWPMFLGAKYSVSIIIDLCLPLYTARHNGPGERRFLFAATLDRPDDAEIARASTEVAPDLLPDLRFRGRRILVQDFLTHGL